MSLRNILFYVSGELSGASSREVRVLVAMCVLPTLRDGLQARECVVAGGGQLTTTAGPDVYHIVNCDLESGELPEYKVRVCVCVCVSWRRVASLPRAACRLLWRASTRCWACRRCVRLSLAHRYRRVVVM